MNAVKIGIIAGNRLLPLILAQRIREKNKQITLVAFAFKGETSNLLAHFVDKIHWLEVGKLKDLGQILQKEGINKCILAGQINPLQIFKRKKWDQELISLVGNIKDFRPHTIFKAIINYLEKKGVEFIDSQNFLDADLAKKGAMNNLVLNADLKRDIDFGVKLVSSFVEMDVGQTVVVKSASAVGLESLEGTDRTIKRAYQLVGRGCTVLKFCKSNQDLRFDLPVVGISTLKLLKRIRAGSLVLEASKVIILEKEKFLFLAKKWGIPVIGREKEEPLTISPLV